MALVEFSVSCALSPCTTSVSAYSSLGISGKLILSGKAMGKGLLFYPPHHYSFYDYVSVTTAISKEAQELKKFASALLPGEMAKQVFTESPCFCMPLPKCWNGQELTVH